MVEKIQARKYRELHKTLLSCFLAQKDIHSSIIFF